MKEQESLSCTEQSIHFCFTGMDALTLKTCIFGLPPRVFGSLTEYIIEQTQRLSARQSQFHDLFENFLELRVEVKFSRVQRQIPKLDTKNILQSIHDIVNAERAVSFDERGSTPFDCNIQQVKKAEFDILVYGLFFDDKIIIFQIPSSSIDKSIGYSDKQHKGNQGEGQFHITEKNIDFHLQHFRIGAMDYEELLKILK